MTNKHIFLTTHKTSSSSQTLLCSALRVRAAALDDRKGKNDMKNEEGKIKLNSLFKPHLSLRADNHD